MGSHPGTEALGRSDRCVREDATASRRPIETQSEGDFMAVGVGF